MQDTLKSGDLEATTRSRKINSNKLWSDGILNVPSPSEHFSAAIGAAQSSTVFAMLQVYL